MAEITLHIGTPKTGSTYIQSTLAAQRDFLRERGWIFPAFVPTPNQAVFSAAFASDFWNRADGFTLLATEDARADTRAELAEHISAEVEPDQQWIISSENFSYQVQEPEQLQQIVEYFSQWFSKVKAVVYFRHQDYMIVSSHAEAYKHFGMRKKMPVHPVPS